MRTLAQADGGDALWLLDEGDPGAATVIDDVVIGCEDGVCAPLVAQELPDVFGRVDPGLTPGLTRGGAGHLGGSGRSVTLAGTARAAEACQPA